MTKREKDAQDRIIGVGNLILSYGSVIYDLESSNARQTVIDALHVKKKQWEERHREMQEQFRAQFRKDNPDESAPYMDAFMDAFMETHGKKGRQ